jgi:hypothetical protein
MIGNANNAIRLLDDANCPLTFGLRPPNAALLPFWRWFHIPRWGFT